jgi:hypothetical protein
MEPNIGAAIIAGSVSFFTAIITVVISFFISRSSIRSEIEKLHIQQKRAFTEKLYELRLDIYPEAFDITQDVGKKGERDHQTVETLIRNTRDNLATWHRKKAGLVLSERSLKAYYELRDALSKQPARQDEFATEQLKKIWFARNVFRGCLRDDVGLLHEEDNEES